MNKVYIVGTILTDPVEVDLGDRGYYEFIIGSNRLSGYTDKIKVRCSLHISKDIIKVGNRVEIKGKYYSQNIDYSLILYINSFSIKLTNDPIDKSTIELEGYVCKKPIDRYTPSNRHINDVMLAVNRGTRSKSDYIPLIIWGKLADQSSKLNVGTKIKITGRIQSREYTKLDKVKIAYEVSVSNFQVIDRSEVI